MSEVGARGRERGVGWNADGMWSWLNALVINQTSLGFVVETDILEACRCFDAESAEDIVWGPATSAYSASRLCTEESGDEIWTHDQPWGSVKKLTVAPSFRPVLERNKTGTICTLACITGAWLGHIQIDRQIKQDMWHTIFYSLRHLWATCEQQVGTTRPLLQTAVSLEASFEGKHWISLMQFMLHQYRHFSQRWGTQRTMKTRRTCKFRQVICAVSPRQQG